MKRESGVEQLVSDDEYVLVNSMKEIVVNGPFTRYKTNDPLNTEKQSCLDLVIVSRDLC